MSDQIFKVTVKGPGTEISRDVEEKQALEILSIALGTKQEFSTESESPSEAAEENVEGNKNTTSDLSVGEFIADLNIQSNDDRIAAIALFLEEHHDQPHFTKDELSTWFQRVGEKSPSNVPRDLNKAVKNRMIAQDTDDPDYYYVTNTGKEKLRNSE